MALGITEHPIAQPAQNVNTCINRYELAINVVGTILLGREYTTG